MAEIAPKLTSMPAAKGHSALDAIKARDVADAAGASPASGPLSWCVDASCCVAPHVFAAKWSDCGVLWLLQLCGLSRHLSACRVPHSALQAVPGRGLMLGVSDSLIHRLLPLTSRCGLIAFWPSLPAGCSPAAASCWASPTF